MIGNKMNNKDILVKLADDVWAVAKKLGITEESRELKAINTCLYDMASGRKTDWYRDFKIKEKNEI